MSVVVLIAWMSLAVLAKVGVVADSALVAGAFNVRQVLFVLAERTVAVDAVVAITAVERLSKRLIDRDEAVARMNELGILDAVGAIIPVWAVQALVTNTVDKLVAAIADG